MRSPEDLERTLREVLRREAPPADFAAQVMARVAAERTQQNQNTGKVMVFPWWRSRKSLRIAAALLVAAVVPASYYAHERGAQQRRAEALEARRQLVMALKITQSKLELARLKLRRKHS